MPTRAIENVGGIFGVYPGSAGIDGDEHAAFIDAAFIVAGINAADTVIGHNLLQPANGATERRARDRSAWDGRGRNRASGNEGTDPGDSEGYDAEQRADACASRDLADELLRVAVAVRGGVLAVMLGNDGDRAVVDTGRAKLGHGALGVCMIIENRGYQVRAHHQFQSGTGLQMSVEAASNA